MSLNDEIRDKKVSELFPALPPGIDPTFPLHQQHATGSTKIFADRKNKDTAWGFCKVTQLPEAMFISGGDNGSPAYWHTCAVKHHFGEDKSIIVDYVILLCPRCGNTLKVEASSEREIVMHFDRASLSPVDNLWRPSISIGPWGCSYHLDGREGVTGPCGGAYGVIRGKLHGAKKRRD